MPQYGSVFVGLAGPSHSLIVNIIGFGFLSLARSFIPLLNDERCPDSPFTVSPFRDCLSRTIIAFCSRFLLENLPYGGLDLPLTPSRRAKMEMCTTLSSRERAKPVSLPDSMRQSMPNQLQSESQANMRGYPDKLRHFTLEALVVFPFSIQSIASSA